MAWMSPVSPVFHTAVTVNIELQFHSSTTVVWWHGQSTLQIPHNNDGIQAYNRQKLNKKKSCFEWFRNLVVGVRILTVFVKAENMYNAQLCTTQQQKPIWVESGMLSRWLQIKNLNLRIFNQILSQKAKNSSTR